MAAKQNSDWSKRNYQIKLLIFGLLITGFGICQLPTILTFRSNLIQVKGTLRSADTYVTTVTDRRGHRSQKSELIFYLNGRKQKYYFAENIGDAYRYERYEKIVEGLQRADTVSVWVRTREVDDYQPEVFQIDSDKTTLLEFEMVRTENSLFTALMFALGFGSILASLWFLFPGKFNRMFGIK